MYVIHATRRTFFAFLNENPLTPRASFSGGSHTGTSDTLQCPFWSGGLSLQPARSTVFRPEIFLRRFYRILPSVNWTSAFRSCGMASRPKPCMPASLKCPVKIARYPSEAA